MSAKASVPSLEAIKLWLLVQASHETGLQARMLCFVCQSLNMTKGLAGVPLTQQVDFEQL